MMPLLRLGLALALAGTPAAAQDHAQAACAGFSWSLTREQAWFQAPSLPKLDSGATLPPDAPSAVLRLKPAAQAELPTAPTREPKPGTYAGFVRIAAPAMAGVYQITLSDEGWLDVIQEGEGPRSPSAHTGKRGCPDLRKSLRFQLGSKPIVVAISNASTETIRFAFAPAP